MLLKEAVCTAFNEQLKSKIAIAESALASAKASRDNETKSSAGDKYETGRELMQFEMDKQSGQLNQLKLLQGELAKINRQQPLQQAGFGSLIGTNQGNYLLSVSLGKVKVGTTSCYALSLMSPLGKVLLGKSVDDSFTFQGKELTIQSLC